MTERTISVVIPNYNRPDTLQRALRSCFDQTRQPFEIIVVDDGSESRHDVERTVKSFRDDRIKLTFQPNAGANVARNRGLEMARGEVVCFLDSDDEFLPTKIERIQSLWPLPHDVIFLSRGLRVRSPKMAFVYPNPPLGDNANYAEWFACDGGNTTSSAVFANHAAFDRCRFTNGLKKFQDSDLLIRAQAAGLKLRMIDDILYKWTDMPAPNRISRGTEFEAYIDWITSLGSAVPARAKEGFLARHIAQHQLPNDPFKNMARIARASRNGAIAWTHAGFMMIRWMLPKRFRELLITHLRRG